MAFTKEEVRSAITEQCDNLLKMLLQNRENNTHDNP